MSPDRRSTKRHRSSYKGPRDYVGCNLLLDRVAAIGEAVAASISCRSQTMWLAGAIDAALRNPEQVCAAIDGTVAPLPRALPTAAIPQPRIDGENRGRTSGFVGWRVLNDRLAHIDDAWQSRGLKNRTVWLAAAIDNGLKNPAQVEDAVSGVNLQLDAPPAGRQFTLPEDVWEVSA